MYKHALIQIYINVCDRLKELIYKYKLNHIKFLEIHSEVYLLMLNILVSLCHRMWLLKQTNTHTYTHRHTHTHIRT